MVHLGADLLPRELLRPQAGHVDLRVGMPHVTHDARVLQAVKMLTHDYILVTWETKQIGCSDTLYCK